MFQGVARVILVGFAEHRVFAHNKNTVYSAGDRAIDYLRGGQPWLVVQLNTPGFLKFRLYDGIGNGLVTGVYIG